MLALAAAHGLVHLRTEQGRLLRGWALAMQGDAATGVAHLHQGLALSTTWDPSRYAPIGSPCWPRRMARRGSPRPGCQVLAEAVTLMATTEVRWWEAEVSRLQGELLLQLPQPQMSPRRKRLFLRALDVARRQQAKALELRAALSLSRLWQQQGKREAVPTLLAPIYGWFTEGFDTPDLQEAKALLAELEVLNVPSTSPGTGAG